MIMPEKVRGTFKNGTFVLPQSQTPVDNGNASASQEPTAEKETVSPEILKLFTRGGTNLEISEILQLSVGEVTLQVSGMPMDKVGTKRGFALYGDAALNNIIKPVQDKKREEERRDISRQRNNAFVRLLLKNNLIPDDLSDFAILFTIYRKAERPFNFSLAEKLRLEFFLRARMLVREGDHSLLMKYEEFGSLVDTDWFNVSLYREEDFIAENEPLQAFEEREDKFGYYKLDEKGNRWRPIVGGDGEGGLGADNSRNANIRFMMRHQEIEEEAGNSKDKKVFSKKTPKKTRKSLTN